MRNDTIGKRTVTLFCVLLLISAAVFYRLLSLAVRQEYVRAASMQSTYSLTVCTTRGRIYDCKMRPLAGGRVQYRAVIEPSHETTEYLFNVLDGEELRMISDRLTGRSPFVYDVSDASIAGSGVRVYRTETRYGENSVAEHIVGYVDGTGTGASGIEYACDSYLKECSGSLTAVYTVNSHGTSLSGEEPEITDTTGNSTGGVVLTLDMDIQRIAEDAAEKYIDRGAVIILEVPSGRIRASVSAPGFDRRDMASSLDSDAAPLINRALYAYDVGSVFKLVVAAAALESGIEPDWTCVCDGSMEIGSNTFHCSNRSGHGELDMCGAVAGSCNLYFIQLARQVGAEKIIELAEKLGFGKEIMLAPNYSAAAGCLPDMSELSNPAALANLSFGQGRLLATPVQIARLAAVIANGGLAPDVSVLECFITPEGERFDEWAGKEGHRVISAETAAMLKEFMIKTVTEGTGRKGASSAVSSAAKTGTAQTGIIRDGRSVLQAWYAGFFPAEAPEYVCVVLVENGQSGGAAAGPVFKYIADRMYGQ